MKEYLFRTDQALLKGLREKPQVVPNSFQKEVAIDIKLEDDTITGVQYIDVSLDSVFNPINLFYKYGIVCDGKFPQIFKGKEVTILNYYGVLFYVDEEARTLTPIRYEKSRNTIKRYTFIDGGYTWFLVNKDCVISCIDGKVTQSAFLGINTGLYYNNRFIFGGFSNATALHPTSSMYKQTDNTVWWSTVGGGYVKEQMSFEPIDPTEYIDRFDIGFASVKGKVLAMVPYRTSFILATTECLYECKFLVDEVVTLSISKLSDMGIYNEDSLAVVNGRVYFINRNRQLVEIADGFKILGYQHLLSVSTDWFLLGSDSRDELYINEGKLAYLYYKNNLTQLSRSVSSIVNIK